MYSDDGDEDGICSYLYESLFPFSDVLGFSIVVACFNCLLQELSVCGTRGYLL